jgi:hypothetical protein
MVTRYDQITHTNMAYLKPDIDTLYNMYAGGVVDINFLAQIDSQFKYMLAYEKSKGEANADTVKQVEIVHDMLTRHFQERLKAKIWSKEHTDNKRQMIQEAIDIVIDSELKKNK